MKAVVYRRYGPPDVLHIEEVPKPEPADDEVLIKVHASAVNRLDMHVREAEASYGLGYQLVARLVLGVRGPRHPIAGSEFSGQVAAAGAAVHEFKPGDEVFGVTGLRFGANAEYVAVRARSRIALKPGNITFDEAAGIADGFLSASGCLRQAHLERGTTVLVYGASGSIGTAGVQLARHLGAHVIAVCQAKDFELARSLGAAELIDYTIEDFTKTGRQYDVIFDAVGKLSFSRSRNSLKSGGWYLPTDGARNLVLAATTRRFGDKRVAMGMGSTTPKQDLQWLKQLIEAGHYRPVIDRIYPIDQVVEAARYVETRQKVGNVVLKVS